MVEPGGRRAGAPRAGAPRASVLRARAVPVKATPTVLSWFDPATVPDRRDVSVVITVPFAAGGQVVVVRLGRGVELPGGHVLPEDGGLEEAARREAWEEARITLGPLGVAQVIRMDYQADPPNTTHIVVYAGQVLRMAPFDRAHESLARMVVSSEDFIDRYGTGTRDDRRVLIAEARAALRSVAPH